uniref:C-type lectin domain-containing protein n=1 Tax=Scleropages formosus TaxID=113540 RepID=A0A8C9TG69_SCLFO
MGPFKTQHEGKVMEKSYGILMVNMNLNVTAFFTGAQGTTNPYILIETYLTWREAQRYCRENYTDLASVRTQVDQQQMKSLVSSTVWIGLFRDPWQWSDQRNSSFRYWAPGKPDNYDGNEKCTVASITQTLSGTWDDRQCGEKHPFICYDGEFKSRPDSTAGQY